MRILYVLLANKEPLQVIKLANILSSNEHYVMIHYNKSSSNVEFNLLKDTFQNNPHIFFTERIKTAWGHFSLTEAIIKSLRKARELDLIYNHAVILSGQDYPIKTNEEIKRFLASHPDKLFYTHFEISPDMGGNRTYVHPINDRVTSRAQNHRLDSYFFVLKDKKYLLIPGEMDRNPLSFRSRFTNRLKSLLRHFSIRKFPSNLKPYFGATFGIITAEFSDYLLNFYDQHKAFNKYMQYAFCADEMYLVTAAMNYPPFASKMVNNNMIFTLWDDKGGLHPVLLTSKHIDQLMNSSKLFARKLDIQVDAKVLDMIDDNLFTTTALTANTDPTSTL